MFAIVGPQAHGQLDGPDADSFGQVDQLSREQESPLDCVLVAGVLRITWTLNGPYDAIALARSGSTAELVQEIVGPIRRLPGVQRALVAPLNDGAARETQPELVGGHAA